MLPVDSTTPTHSPYLAMSRWLSCLHLTWCSDNGRTRLSFRFHFLHKGRSSSLQCQQLRIPPFIFHLLSLCVCVAGGGVGNRSHLSELEAHLDSSATGKAKPHSLTHKISVYQKC